MERASRAEQQQQTWKVPVIRSPAADSCYPAGCLLAVGVASVNAIVKIDDPRY